MNIQAAILLADAGKPGLLETLSPWRLIGGGVVLVLLAGLFFFLDKKKVDNGSGFFELAAVVCGIAGAVALFQGLFGG